MKLFCVIVSLDHNISSVRTGTLSVWLKVVRTCTGAGIQEKPFNACELSKLAGLGRETGILPALRWHVVTGDPGLSSLGDGGSDEFSKEGSGKTLKSKNLACDL